MRKYRQKELKNLVRCGMAHDLTIITVAITASHMTMQEIANAIALALEGAAHAEQRHETQN